MQERIKKLMINKYKLNGYNIVVDSNSGGVHLFDDISFDILDFITEKEGMNEEIDRNIIESLKNKYKEEEIIEAYKELFKLYSSDLLFSKDTYEKFTDMMTDAPIKSMCLNVAHDCNLRCEYCFAAKGDFGQGRMLMSLETGKKAIDFLIKHSGKRHNLELDFFGGEPLMNFEVVKGVVDYAREEEKKYNKNFRFTITTNGLLLTDDKIDYINKEMSNVVLSLDGRKEVNDRLRVTPTGKGCYDIIVPKYQKLVEGRGKDKDYYVRGTFTKHNLDFSNDVLHMYELGFDQISIEPVVSDPQLDYSIKEEDLERVFKEYENLSNKIIESRKNKKYFNFFHFMIDLDQGPCAIKRLRGCGCGNEYIAVTPNGDIFPCHQFVGDDKWKMGNINEGTFDNEMKKYFAGVNVYTKKECQNCWARFYCSGGCNANNYKYEGDISKSHKISCDLQKKRLECAIMLKAAEKSQ